MSAAAATAALVGSAAAGGTAATAGLIGTAGAVTGSGLLGAAAGLGGLASGAAAIAGMAKGSPKAPAPVATPAAPSINMARQAAGAQAGNTAQGALANMLTPYQNTGQLTQQNSSLKQLLGQ